MPEIRDLFESGRCAIVANVGPLIEPVLKPLYGAYEALERARSRRGTAE